MSLDLRAPLRSLRGIGPSRERQLAAEGVRDVGALLAHLPARYEDRREVLRIAALSDEGPVTLSGHLRGVRLVLRRGRRFSLVRGRLEDESGSIPVVWFNRPYLPRQIDPEIEYLLHGRAKRRSGELQLQNASCEPLDRALHAGRITPVYAPLGPLGPSLVRRLLTELVEGHDLSRIEDPLPAAILERRALAPLGRALVEVHRPGPDASPEELNRRSTPAHRRLVYGELLAFQLGLALARRRASEVVKGHRVEPSEAIDRRIEELVPFRLTDAQRRVIGEIVDDLARPAPMRRLLQGDVGSGKTVVAVAALVAAIDSGLQTAFMAPTELLAEQHFTTLEDLLGERYRLALLTASSNDREARLEALAAGEVDLVVGTHALIEEDVRFRRLGLAVIDEQHRFGVGQRSRLGEKGGRCDLLVMTATPIPRSLTLTAYGDLDLSVIDELPPGRRPIDTRVVAETRRDDVYRELREAVEAGARGYVVFPMIEEQSESAVASLEAGVSRLAKLLPADRFAAIEGSTPIGERLAIMDSFARGELALLAATTVVEVGVDVPAASLMVIESAERFGLAQLHQLRGRVGRSEVASVCWAIHGKLTDAAERRLEAFAGTDDGFVIAEADLAIRGPGELLGTRQAGMPRFLAADADVDEALLAAARADARQLVEVWAPDEVRCRIEALGGAPLDETQRLRRS